MQPQSIVCQLNYAEWCAIVFSSPLKVIHTGGHMQAVSFPHQLNQLWLCISKALLPCLLFMVPSISVFEIHFLKSILNLFSVARQRQNPKFTWLQNVYIYVYLSVCHMDRSPFFKCKDRHLYIVYTTVHMYFCHAVVLTSSLGSIIDVNGADFSAQLFFTCLEKNSPQWHNSAACLLLFRAIFLLSTSLSRALFTKPK